MTKYIMKVQSINFKVKKLLFICIWLLFFTFAFLLFTLPTYAISDPTSVPNNKFGIHLISASTDEASPAADLVNSSGGDWGYITVLIEQKDKNKDKWQNFFNDLRRRHLIPIVRIATEPDGGNWKLPNDGEEEAWADFLNSLNWPIKNRYVTIYNEPNHGQEWGGKVDPRSYARVLDKTLTALKKRSPDFFVLNAGLDASTPEEPPNYKEETNFLIEMDQEVPGIFNKLDGWTSHSYPNPGFVGSPNGVGKGTIRTWYWELQTLRSLGVTKYLPVFITETGWKHAEGINYDSSLPTAQTTANYYKEAFENGWNSSQIVAITPFLFSYQNPPFDHFSFKKIDSKFNEEKNLLNAQNVLGAEASPYYPQFHTIQDLTKISGQPIQTNSANLVKGEIYSTLVAGESYQILLTFKNTGQSIWNDIKPLELKVDKGAEVGITTLNSEPIRKIEPGQELTFQVLINSIPSNLNQLKSSFQLVNNGREFESSPFIFTSQIKSPVSIFIKGLLGWKSDSSGEYLLEVSSDVGQTLTPVTLNKTGASELLEARYLLPDYEFDFTLSKPFYKSKTIHQKVISGENHLDFGTLDPDILGSILYPTELWKLFPWGN